MPSIKLDKVSMRFGSGPGFAALEVERLSDGVTITVGFSTAESFIEFLRKAQIASQTAWPGRLDLVELREEETH